MNNIQKTIKNSIIAVSSQVITLLLQFINRRVFILFLDIEYLGYQSLFSNIFNLLSVAELGIGNIIAFHLYKEIVDNNTVEIGRLMYLYKWLYRIVAALVCVAGCICCFLLPYFIKDATASWTYLYFIYFLQLASVVVGYFLSYKQTIFIATQQEYKCVQIELFVGMGIQLFQIIVLMLFRNYIIYLCVHLSTSLISNIIISYRANKEFPYLKGKYSVSKEYIKSRNMFVDLRDFLIHKISYAVYGGTDNIIISMFCGVRTVGLYGNYTMVQTGVLQLLFIKLLNPVQATIGNIVYGKREKEELWNQFQIMDVFSYFFATYIGLGFLVFFQPFIQLWMGKEYILFDTFVALLAFTIYFEAVWEVVYKYRSVFGNYKQDRWFMMLSAIMNIVISILGVRWFGIAGVQFGTLVSFLPIAYGRIRFVVGNIFKKSIPYYLLKHFVLAGVAVMEAIICFWLTKWLAVNMIGFLERLIIWLVIPFICNTLLFYKNPHFHELIHYFCEIISIVKTKFKR